MAMRNYRIQSVDGPIHFRGRQLAKKRGQVAMPDGTAARMAVTIYSTRGGEGIIREDITWAGRKHTFVHRNRRGTSPSWSTPEHFPAATELLNQAWALACRIDERLRPVKKWQITGECEEFQIRTGDETYLVVRAGAIPRR